MTLWEMESPRTYRKSTDEGSRTPTSARYSSEFQDAFRSKSSYSRSSAANQADKSQEEAYFSDLLSYRSEFSCASQFTCWKTCSEPNSTSTCKLTYAILCMCCWSSTMHLFELLISSLLVHLLWSPRVHAIQANSIFNLSWRKSIGDYLEGNAFVMKPKGTCNPSKLNHQSILEEIDWGSSQG